MAPTHGLAATKNALQRSWQNTLKEQLDVSATGRELGRSSDYVEGVTALPEKRRRASRAASVTRVLRPMRLATLRRAQLTRLSRRVPRFNPCTAPIAPRRI